MNSSILALDLNSNLGFGNRPVNARLKSQKQILFANAVPAASCLVGSPEVSSPFRTATSWGGSGCWPLAGLAESTWGC